METHTMLELDDYHHLTTPRNSERPRRGTFDTLYASRNLQMEAAAEAGGPDRNVPESAISDNETDSESLRGVLPTRRTRRMTADSTMSHSPPNSVKAFAQARRRERDTSFSETTRPCLGDEKDAIARRTSVGGRSTRSHRSHRSYRSRKSHRSCKSCNSHASRAESMKEKSLLGSIPSDEHYICLPTENKDQLQIDYDLLEEFMQEQREERDRRQANATKDIDLIPEDITEGAPHRRPGTSNSSSRSHHEKPGDSESSDDARLSKPAPQHSGQGDSARINLFSSSWESIIHANDLCDMLMPWEPVRTLFEFSGDDEEGVWWLNINNPAIEELNVICRVFGVHPLTLEDIAQQESREKIELFPAYYFLCFRSFNVVYDEKGVEEYEPLNFYAIVFREGTLSFSFSPNQHALNVRTRIGRLKDFVALSSDWICYALIDDIVDSYSPIIRNIENIVDQLEDSVFVIREEDSSDFSKKVSNTRRNVTALSRLLGGKADVLKGFTKRCNENYHVTPRMDIGMYLDDIQDHVLTMATSLIHFERMLGRVHQSYLTQLTVNSIFQSTAINDALSKITFLATVLVPLNLVSGLFGMNVPVPWRDTENLGPFFGIMGFMVVILVIMIVIARRLHYI